MRFALGKLLQLDHAQRIEDARRDFRRRRFLHPQTEGDVFEYAHMGKQSVALENGIDVAVFRRNMSDVLIFEMNSPAVDVFKPGNKTKNGGFTAARGAKQGEKLTVVDGQIQI